jgi:MFS family permease
VLGFVSLFMDVSSEMIHSLLPVFLVSVLGATAVSVGLIEGVGEATASISKLFSGWLSDRLHRRKALTAIGYGLSTLSKPLFAVAPSPFWVLAARFSDRVGKGIRGAPRDALIGDVVPRSLRGAAYGLRQSLDTVGAFAGPLLAMALMAISGDDFRLVFWVAVIPGLIAVGILVAGVREPQRAVTQPAGPNPVVAAHLGRFDVGFWIVVAITATLTLARFSEAFLILRAQGAGLEIVMLPLVLVTLNAVYALSAYPLGILSDRIDRRTLLAFGFGILILADLALALAPGLPMVMLGIALWGLHMGMTQGQLSALVVDTAPAALRGTAFGLFHLASGIAMLLASLIAGVLWDFIGSSATFLAGAAFSAIGLAGILFVIRRRPTDRG